MEMIIIWAVTGMIGASIIVWGIVYYFLKINSKPTYITKQGCRVFCEAKHMKTRKQDVEDEIDRFVSLVNSRFERGRQIEELRRMIIIFKNGPFKPETNVATTSKRVSGVYQVKKRTIVVAAKEFQNLQETAMAHEMLHYMMDVVDHLVDLNHKLSNYWKLIGE